MSAGLSPHAAVVCAILYTQQASHTGTVDGAARSASSCRRCLRQARSACARQRNAIQFSNSLPSRTTLPLPPRSGREGLGVARHTPEQRFLPIAPRPRERALLASDPATRKGAWREGRSPCITSRSRRAIHASFSLLVPPSPIRGRGECRAPDAPDSRVCNGSGRTHTR